MREQTIQNRILSNTKKNKSVTSDSRHHHVTSFKNTRTEKKRFIATGSKYYSLTLSDVIGSSIWGEVTFNYNVYMENWDVAGFLGAKGWASAWPERVIEFIKQFRGKQFVVFCNSCREKPRELSQSQATTKSPNSLEPFERQLFSTFKKSGVRRKSRSASLVPSFSTNSARYTVSSKTQLMTLLDKSQNLYDPTLSFT